MEFSSSSENYQYQQQYPYQQQPQDAAAAAAAAAAAYDPSQAQQAYDQSAASQAYYDYGYNTSQQQPQQYQYYYYPPPYHYPYSQQQPTHLDNQLDTQHHWNPGSVFGSGVSSAPPIPPFSVSVDGSQGGSQTRIGKSTHRGGRRGNRPFRGGGRGHSTCRVPRQNGSMPSSSASGNGQGGGRPLSVSVPGHVPGQGPATPLWPPPRMAWCELCRVDCNTLEILEQHKNGKRHKKNLQTHEELQNLNQIITGQQNVQMPNSEFKPGIPSENVVGSKVDLTSQVVSIDNRNETEHQKDDVGKSEVPVADSAEVYERTPRDHCEAQGRGIKRKMKGGRRRKYVRTNDGPRRPAEPPKPKQVIPFICELCNVKCESQVVFDSHLAGKKHLSKLEQFHGHQALYGELGLQALYPQNLNGASCSVIPQIQQGVNDPQVVLAQLLNYVLAHVQAPVVVNTQVPVVAGAPVAAVSQAAPAPVPDSGIQYDNCLNQGSKAIPEGAESQQCVTAEFEAPSTGNMDTKEENGSSACEAGDSSLHLDNKINISLPRDDAKVADLPPGYES